MLERSLQAARESQRRLRADAEAKRDAELAAREVPKEQWRSWPVAVVPSMRAPVGELATARRAAFAAHLRELLRGARAQQASGVAIPVYDSARVDQTTTSRQKEIDALLGATCGACGGACCTNGRDHAFLTDDSMRSYLQRFPRATDDQVVTDYLAYLPRHTHTNSCVFHRADGCALPRDMRSALCNRFVCAGLRVVRDAFDDHAPIRAFIAHQEGEQLTSGRLLPVLGPDT